MDRSFLSQPQVITASRRFVCVRLMTYENAEEARLLKSLLATRSGELENSVFAILAPDGQRHLVRAARSPKQSFPDAEQLARAMNRIADDYRTEERVVRGHPDLPTVANLRLGVNVAACDNRPLVVVTAQDQARRAELEQRLAALAWSPPFLGRFIYAIAADSGERQAIEGTQADSGLLVVQPDRFGLKGAVLAQASSTSSRAELERCLQLALVQYQAEAKRFSIHVRTGQQLGVFWETVLPVTDPLEQQARERGRQRARPE